MRKGNKEGKHPGYHMVQHSREHLTHRFHLVELLVDLLEVLLLQLIPLFHFLKNGEREGWASVGGGGGRENGRGWGAPVRATKERRPGGGGG